MTNEPGCPGHLVGFPSRCDRLDDFFARDHAAVQACAYLTARDAVCHALEKEKDAFVYDALRRWVPPEVDLVEALNLHLLFTHPVLIAALGWDPLERGGEPLVKTWLASERAGECAAMRRRRDADFGARTDVWEVTETLTRGFELTSVRDGRRVRIEGKPYVPVPTGNLLLARIYEEARAVACAEPMLVSPDYAAEVRSFVRPDMTALELFEAFYFCPECAADGDELRN